MKIQWSTAATYSPVKEKIQHCLLIYMHTWPCCPVMCEKKKKKTETIKHRPTPWRNVNHGVCVCVYVSHIICSSNSATFSGDHSCHCIRCDVTMATFSPLRLFLVSASSHRRQTRPVWEEGRWAKMAATRKNEEYCGSEFSILSPLKRIMCLE